MATYGWPAVPTTSMSSVCLPALAQALLNTAERAANERLCRSTVLDQLAVDVHPCLAAGRSDRSVPGDARPVERERGLRPGLRRVAHRPTRVRASTTPTATPRCRRSSGSPPSSAGRRAAAGAGGPAMSPRRRLGVVGHDPGHVARRVGRPAAGPARARQPPVGDASPALEAAVQRSHLGRRDDLLVGRRRSRVRVAEVAVRPMPASSTGMIWYLPYAPDDGFRAV